MGDDAGGAEVGVGRQSRKGTVQGRVRSVTVTGHVTDNPAEPKLMEAKLMLDTMMTERTRRM
jgi:hypothetical protein